VEEDAVPCPVCGSADEEEVLLLCDACDAPYHTHCVSLDGIPNGHWYCMECVHSGAGTTNGRSADPTVRYTGNGHRSHQRTRQPRSWAQRTQAQVRRARHRHTPEAWQGAWNQISTRVYDALNLDLEYDDEDDSLTEFRRVQRRTDRHARDFQRWQQRVAIAGRQGARDVFREAAQPLLNNARELPAEPPVQTLEEKKAWDAFERTRGLDSTPPSRKRKSRSITASPVEEAPTEPERKLKRPRTRRVVDRPNSSSAVEGESSRQGAVRHSATPRRPSCPNTSNGAAPSFLSSLLREVEMSTPTEEDHVPLPISMTNPATSPSADYSSPAASPATSSYSTPRAMSITPPPYEKRPGSPLPLTSHVEPIYPHAEYSPNRSPLEYHNDSASSRPNTPPNNDIRHPRPRRQQRPVPRSQDTSPTRASMSIEAKEGINKIVRSALEPHYKKPAGITKEQYATINRLVSRMLYDKIADPDNFENAKESWEKVANAEVAKAVEGLTV
jgi:hypothetical protein